MMDIAKIAVITCAMAAMTHQSAFAVETTTDATLETVLTADHSEKLSSVATTQVESSEPGVKTESKKKFSITPTARALFDIAFYLPKTAEFKHGVAMPEARLGAKTEFGDFATRTDLAYRFGKIYAADIYLQWNINRNMMLRGGYFIHQFGLQSATGSSDKISMEEPSVYSALGESRLLGAMYVYQDKKFHFATSLYAQGSLLSKHPSETGRTGVGYIARALWKPLTDDGNIFHIGGTALIQTATFNGDTHNPVSVFKSSFPTRVENVTLVEAEVDHTQSIFKLSPEVLWSKGRLCLEGQFIYMLVSRKDGYKAFNAHGGYLMGRYILKGSNYTYSPWIGYVHIPKPKTWEVTAGYSYIDLNDSHSMIYGGTGHTGTVTLNYYINKYLTWRFNYSYTARPGAHNIESKHANIFQTRIQFVF